MPPRAASRCRRSMVRCGGSMCSGFSSLTAKIGPGSVFPSTMPSRARSSPRWHRARSPPCAAKSSPPSSAAPSACFLAQARGEGSISVSTFASARVRSGLSWALRSLGLCRRGRSKNDSRPAKGDNGMAPFWQRPRATPREVRVDEECSAQIDDYLAGQIEESGPGLALAVVETESVVHAAGYGLADIRNERPIVPETILHLASCGKQLTGLGILMLAEAGKLRPDDPIGRYLAPLAGFGPRVTIRRLLQHTSGIRDFYDDAGVDEVLARVERPSNADVIRLCAELGCPMADDGNKPGESFAYSNTGYDMLGEALARFVAV